ncbi:MAG: phage tail assembly chaperone [Acidaminococcaceae bacterium]
MSLIDKLLQADVRKLTELPTKKYEVKRLSKELKSKFELELQAIPAQRYSEIQRNGVEMSAKGGVKNIKLYDMQTLTLIDGIKEPSLKDKSLLAHFNAVTPKELAGKLFLAGEIADIYNEINELSGYEKDEETDEEIKN